MNSKAQSPVLELELSPPRPALPPQSDAVMMFERLAKDPAVDVEKLERLIAMQERILDRNAEMAFNAAFAQMQPKIPTIGERSRTDKTAYAPLEDILDVVRPILAEFGFTLSFRSEFPTDKTVKVFGILTHLEGHARTSEFLSAADQTGSKNAIQALGSATQYGRRYTTKDLLCIVTREADDDGESSEQYKAPEMPAGYDDWMTHLSDQAKKGTPALMKAWNDSKPEYRQHVTKHQRDKWEALKKHAAGVK